MQHVPREVGSLVADVGALKREMLRVLFRPAEPEGRAANVDAVPVGAQPFSLPPDFVAGVVGRFVHRQLCGRAPVPTNGAVRAAGGRLIACRPGET